jgi:hypothetical protein
MAIHRRREEARPGARLVLESDEPVELPAAAVNLDGVTLEREEFRPHLEQLLDMLEQGTTATPAPVVMSDSIFVIEGSTRTYWVRIWHLGPERTLIDRLHVVSCVPRIRGLKLPNLK